MSFAELHSSCRMLGPSANEVVTVVQRSEPIYAGQRGLPVCDEVGCLVPANENCISDPGNGTRRWGRFRQFCPLRQGNNPARHLRRTDRGDARWDLEAVSRCRKIGANSPSVARRGAVSYDPNQKPSSGVGSGRSYVLIEVEHVLGSSAALTFAKPAVIASAEAGQDPVPSSVTDEVEACCGLSTRVSGPLGSSWVHFFARSSSAGSADWRRLRDYRWRICSGAGNWLQGTVTFPICPRVNQDGKLTSFSAEVRPLKEKSSESTAKFPGGPGARLPRGPEERGRGGDGGISEQGRRGEAGSIGRSDDVRLQSVRTRRDSGHDGRQDHALPEVSSAVELTSALPW